jgi:Tetratricopeptide repeat
MTYRNTDPERTTSEGREYGDWLIAEARFEEAISVFTCVLALEPHSTGARLGMAHALLGLGAPHDAIPHLEALLAHEPDNARAHVSLGVACYEIGDINRAWDEFGWFYCSRSNLSPRKFARPLWDGSSLTGRTILLWTDQGLGDTLLFLRYIPLVKAIGCTVLVECHHPGILPFVIRMPEVDRALNRTSQPPVYDVHAPIIHLPSIFRESRMPLPASVPYVSVDAELKRTWEARMRRTTDKLIGLCWESGPGHVNAKSRSIPLAHFESLADTPNTRFVSLQINSDSAPPYIQCGRLKVENVLTSSCSLSDTAALMLNLDLVITVDTMIPHLAGALGLPVWTLLRFAPSWRYWGIPDRMSWFPTMRLFRQVRAREWGPVIENVRAALEQHAWPDEASEHSTA